MGAQVGLGKAEREAVLRTVAPALRLVNIIRTLRKSLDYKGVAGAQVGLGEAEREAVLRTVAAVLHLGNIQFAPAADEGAAPVGTASATAIAAVADLMEARCPGVRVAALPCLQPSLRTSQEPPVHGMTRDRL